MSEESMSRRDARGGVKERRILALKKQGLNASKIAKVTGYTYNFTRMIFDRA